MKASIEGSLCCPTKAAEDSGAECDAREAIDRLTACKCRCSPAVVMTRLPAASNPSGHIGGKIIRLAATHWLRMLPNAGAMP